MCKIKKQNEFEFFLTTYAMDCGAQYQQEEKEGIQTQSTIQ